MSSQQVGKLPTRRSRPSYINSIVMIALVLFLLGSVGVFYIAFEKAADKTKEGITVSAILKTGVNEVEALQLHKRIESMPFVKSLEYISKEKALQIFIEDFNEDPEETLGYIPLPASFEMKLKADYVHPDTLARVEEKLLAQTGVRRVKVNEQLISKITDFKTKAGLVLLAVSLVFLLIVVTVIDKTIRLIMYSNRFLVRSMQLVGATRWFIVKPYVIRSIINGMLSALLAIGGLVGLSYFADSQFGKLALLDDYFKFGLLAATLLLIGVLISWWSTHRAVSKYLKMKLDELY